MDAMIVIDSIDGATQITNYVNTTYQAKNVRITVKGPDVPERTCFFYLEEMHFVLPDYPVDPGITEDLKDDDWDTTAVALQVCGETLFAVATEDSDPRVIEMPLGDPEDTVGYVRDTGLLIISGNWSMQIENARIPDRVTDDEPVQDTKVYDFGEEQQKRRKPPIV